jgi:hypothetical protein
MGQTAAAALPRVSRSALVAAGYRAGPNLRTRGEAEVLYGAVAFAVLEHLNRPLGGSAR